MYPSCQMDSQARKQSFLGAWTQSSDWQYALQRTASISLWLGLLATANRTWGMKITNNNLAPRKPRTNHSTQTRSLRSRSRIDWAVEAARRVGGLDRLGD